MTNYVKRNNIWTSVSAIYRKINNTWQTRSNILTALDNNIYFYSTEDIGIIEVTEPVLVIGGPLSTTGATCQYTLTANNVLVTSGATWSITSGSSYATINNSGLLTILSGANNSQVTISVSYNGSTKTKTVTVTYQSGTNSTSTSETETMTDPNTGATTITTTTTTTTTDSQGNTTTSTTTSETTTNQDGSSTQTDTTQNSDGSSQSVTTNYDENGDPTDTTNVNTDTQGNVNTQDITYDNNGDPVVTGYNIDTTGNNDGGETLTDGLDTGVIVFDGHDWTATLKATILFNDITPASTQFPIINVSSRGDDNKLDGAFFLATRQTSGMGSSVYNESGTQLSTTTSSNPTLKWRIQSYLGGSLQNGIDFYYKNGTRPYYTNRFGSKTATLTLTYKMIYTNSNHQLVTEIYASDGTTILAKPRSESVITFSRTLTDVTFEIGQAVNVSGTELKTKLEIINFNIEKTL